MKYLKDKGYIEKKIHFGANDPLKGKGPCYSIPRTIRVLSAIYHDPEFNDLQSMFRTDSDWVPGLILEERFDFLDNATKRDTERMLISSKAFFEICLNNQMSRHLFLTLKKLFPGTQITSRQTGHYEPALTNFYLSKVAVYDLFIYCMYKENFEKMIGGEMPDDAKKLLDEMVIRRTRLKNEIQNYHTSIIISDLLTAVVEKCKRNNNQIPDDLMKKMKEFQVAVENTKGDGFSTPRIRSKPLEFLREIKDDLGINPEIKRR